MNSEQLVPTLMIVTLVIVLVLAIVQFGFFLRKRRNRDLAKRAFKGDENPN